MNRALLVLSLAVGLLLAPVPRSQADDQTAAPAGAAPGAQPTSIWNWFGIPQTSQKLRDARLNRSGEHPNRERVPPLKRIADPENLKSENPAIKVAAEAKADEDLKVQKIKAVKFLATVCCCCSQYKAEVKKALLAGLEDCTEEVRYETAVALCQCSGDPCTICNRCSCCDPDIMAKLREMAEGKDPDGCYLESSPRVRAAALSAVEACENVFRPTGPAPAGPTPFQQEVPGKEVRPSPQGTAPGEPKTSSGPRTRMAGMERPGPSTEGSAGRSGQGEGGAAPGNDREFFPRDGTIRSEGGQFGMVSYQPQVTEYGQPLEAAPPTVGPERPFFKSFDIQEAAERLRAPAPQVAEGGSAGEARSLAQTDLGGFLQQSSTVESVDVQRRSPVALDPHIRGYKQGQIYTQANGVFWTPARLDLDTMLNKIDPGMIQDVVIIPGPYGLRYGPGFAFINVERAPLLASDCPETDFDSALYERGNGGQIYFRETITGSGPNYGYRFSYGARKGSDYLAGKRSDPNNINSLKIPSDYESQDVWGELAYYLNPNRRVEFTYMRLDQGRTAYPCQFFDIGNLGTYGFEGRIVDTDPEAAWSKLTAEAWYNHTGFRGDTAFKRLQHFPVLQRVDSALFEEATGVTPVGPVASSIDGRTNGNVFSSGVRLEATFGEPEEKHWNVGADFRYLGQRITERFDVTNPIVEPLFPEGPTFFTNMPRAWSIDPGVYAELAAPLTESWTATLGARLDWVTTTARQADVRIDPDTGDPLNPNFEKPLEQNDILYAFYYMNKWKLNEAWTLSGGFGYGQRPPTLIERYADSLFLSLAQSGFTRMFGDPALKPERDWQIDVGLEVRQEKWRGKANFFYAWVIDYVTYADETVTNFADARQLFFVNTPLATLTGCELEWEYYWLPRLTPFARMSYVDGRDQTLGAPLPAIPPLDSTLGLRFHDTDRGRKWGVELAARVVSEQWRLGTVRSGDAKEIIEEHTPGFGIWNLRGYWNVKERLNLIGGIDNLFDRSYQEHLDLRLLGPTGFPSAPTRVLSPGLTAYAGVNWVF